MKYIGKENALHLVNALKQNYEIKIDWKGEIYCGITLNWNYKKCYVQTKMPTYAMKQIKKYKHKLKQRCHPPLQLLPQKYGKAAQEPTPADTSKPLGPKDIKKIKQVSVVSSLWQSRWPYHPTRLKHYPQQTKLSNQKYLNKS